MFLYNQGRSEIPNNHQILVGHRTVNKAFPYQLIDKSQRH